MARRTLFSTCLLLSILATGAIPTHAASTSVAPQYKLGSDPNGLAFGYSVVGGNLLGGAFKVSIYNGGKVVLTGTTRVHLEHPDMLLTKTTLRGLMRLAGALKIFSLPNQVTGPRTNPDLPGHRLTVKTATGIKTLEERGVSNERFDELYTILAGLTPRCSGDATTTCLGS